MKWLLLVFIFQVENGQPGPAQIAKKLMSDEASCLQSIQELGKSMPKEVQFMATCVSETEFLK
jgi:hypothetical protein